MAGETEVSSSVKSCSCRPSSCAIVLSALVCSVILILLGTCFYELNHYWSTECTEDLMTFTTRGSSLGDILWAYVTFWKISESLKARALSGNRALPEAYHYISNDVKEILEKTFKPLSLQPFADLPKACQERVRRRGNESRPARYVRVYTLPQFTESMTGHVFSVRSGLRSEFRFRDDVMVLARFILRAAESIAAERMIKYDQVVPIYVSEITPELERRLWFKRKDIKLLQLRQLRSAIKEYRRNTKSLFIVLGNAKWAKLLLREKDVLTIETHSESVSLAVMSFGTKGIIFNHGLLPSFGALLAGANVTAHTVRRTLVNTATKAALTWKAANLLD